MLLLLLNLLIFRLRLQGVLSRLCYLSCLSCTDHGRLMVADCLLMKGQLLSHWPHARDHLATLARGMAKTRFAASLLSHRWMMQVLNGVSRLEHFRAVLPVRMCAELLAAVEEHAASIVRIYCLRDAELLR